MEQGLRKYWYNSGVVIKEVDENRVSSFRFSPLGEEGKDGVFPNVPNGVCIDRENGDSTRSMVGNNESVDICEESRRDGFEEGKAEGAKQGYQEGFRKGKEEGFTTGFQEGKREGIALLEKRFQGLVERAKNSIERLAKARKELQESLRSYEADLVSLAFEIGASIAMRELQERPERIGEIVRKALEKIGDSGDVVVKLNPKDLTLLRESGEVDTEGIQMVSSPSISRGGCVVETEKGVVNATLETRIREVADSLIEGGEARDASD